MRRRDPAHGPLGHVVYELRRNATATELDWWETCTASVVIDCAASWPTMVVFAGLAQLLREGADPDWLAGGRSPAAALAVAREWLEVGVEPSDVTGWFRAGCWDPATAMKLAAARLRPGHLVTADGQPAHWVDAPDGQRVPLAQAIAEWDMPVEDALHYIRSVGRP